ncbi:hypothetical protein LDENG_00088310 [Lucifuga dentata]|nr:hypothetical protein LDENG_00088310 [Lucifuga dentata]
MFSQEIHHSKDRLKEILTEYEDQIKYPNGKSWYIATYARSMASKNKIDYQARTIIERDWNNLTKEKESYEKRKLAIAQRLDQKGRSSGGLKVSIIKYFLHLISFTATCTRMFHEAAV